MKISNIFDYFQELSTKLKQKTPYGKRLFKAAELAESGQYREAIEVLDRAKLTAFGLLKIGVLFIEGMILTDWARNVASREESIELLENACHNFDQIAGNDSVLEDSYKSAIHLEWANALADYGRKSLPPNKTHLYLQANDQYMKANKIEADQPELYNNWGNLLTDLAIEVRGSRAERFLSEACVKFQQGLELDNQSCNLYSNWGRSLFLLASQSKEAKGYREAKDKFQDALHIDPEHQKANAGMGATCFELAVLDESQETNCYFEMACKYLETAIELKPDDDESLYNLANTCWEYSKQQSDAQVSKTLLTKAVSCGNQAIEINDENAEAYFVLGGVLLDRAFQSEQNEKRLILVEAGWKFQAAIERKPNFAEAYVNQGSVFLNLAKVCEESVKKDMLLKSCDNYSKAVQLNPGIPKAANNYMVALFRIAEMSDVKEKNETLDKIISVYQNEPAFRVGSWAYNVACVHNLKDDKENCKKWLLAGEKENAIETRHYAMSDPDLESVRGELWFQQIRWKGE